MSLKFDIQGYPEPSTIVDGKVDSLTVIDIDGNPNRSLSAANPFTVVAQWEINGSGVTGFGGTWTCRLFAESKGPGPEVEVLSPGMVVAVSSPEPGATPIHAVYKATFTVPAGTLQADGPTASGVYDLSALVTHTSEVTGLKDATAGFSEDEVIEIHNP
jgi:hypothetical protein